MDPKNFLEFAKVLCGTCLCDVETDSRVGIDRSYYAAAHISWNTIHDCLMDIETDEIVIIFERLHFKIHYVLDATLREIRSSLKGKMRSLKQRRTNATYDLDMNITGSHLQSAVEIATYLLDQQALLKEEINQAYQHSRISSSFWRKLSVKFDNRAKKRKN